MEYLLVVPLPFHQVEPGVIACESAFAEHLRMSIGMLAPRFTKMTIAAPTMNPQKYAADKDHLGHLTESDDHIGYVPLHPTDIGRIGFLLKAPALYSRMKKAARSAGLVHGGLSYDVWKPFEFVSLLIGAGLKKKTVFVIDIDHRASADMDYQNGHLSKKSYWLIKNLYDPFRSWQIKTAVRKCSLLMLKSQSLVDDYGQGKEHVKNFIDVAFAPEYVIPEARLEAKIEACKNPDSPLDLVYFGRLVPYKGIDYCIRAVHEVRNRGHEVRLHIIGGGDQDAELKALNDELGGEGVIFYGPLPFGPDFFERLYNYHILLAAPLHEDTPRSAFDAMAAGIPLLAFDTYYYQNLTNTTGACSVVPWRSVEGMADRIVHYLDNRDELAQQMRRGVSFAKENTQQIWMERRMSWINGLFDS